MGMGWKIAITIAVVSGSGSAAVAEPADQEGDRPAEAEIDPEDGIRFSHQGQVGIHVQGGFGYRGLFPYDGEYCGALKDDGTASASCLGRSPFGLDVGLAYGLSRRVELVVEGRFGVERDVGPTPADSGPRSVALAPGIKGYIADIGPTMLFASLQLPIDFTSFDQIDKTDIGVRNVNGLQLDLHRTFGVFLFFGEEVSWRRWLRFEVMAGLGVQVRFP